MEKGNYDLWKFIFLLIIPFSYHSMAFDISCDPRVTIFVGIRSEVSCNVSVSQNDIIGLYWRSSNGIILRLEDGTRRGGSRLGELNISDNGAMIIENPQYSDAKRYEFLVVTRADGNMDHSLILVVIDPPEPTSKKYVEIWSSQNTAGMSITVYMGTATTVAVAAKKSWVIVVIAIFAAFSLTVIILLLCWFYLRSKRRRGKLECPTAPGTVDSAAPNTVDSTAPDNMVPIVLDELVPTVIISYTVKLPPKKTYDDSQTAVDIASTFGAHKKSEYAENNSSAKNGDDQWREKEPRERGAAKPIRELSLSSSILERRKKFEPGEQ